ncbi:MAG TPA: ATP-binding protein [Thermoanaerobaculia bacterium]|nr:ATP-binding protein [Thermoanaerobaculia bacterium]
MTANGAREPAAIRRPGTLDHLPALVDFVRDACERSGADASSCFAMRLAVEEVCVNLMRHAYGAGEPGPIEVIVDGSPGRLLVTITDFAPPFSPEEAPAPDLDGSWEERRIGGLGWHLVKSVVDEVRYEARPREGNRLTLVKRTEPRPDVGGGER